MCKLLTPNCFVYSTPKHPSLHKSRQPWHPFHDHHTKSRVVIIRHMVVHTEKLYNEVHSIIYETLIIGVVFFLV